MSVRLEVLRAITGVWPLETHYRRLFLRRAPRQATTKVRETTAIDNWPFPRAS